MGVVGDAQQRPKRHMSQTGFEWKVTVIGVIGIELRPLLQTVKPPVPGVQVHDRCGRLCGQSIRPRAHQTGFESA